jgi:hypothetical protein
VLEMYRALATTAPPELTCAAMLRLAPTAAWLPREIHGKPVVMLIPCHSGPVREGAELLAPMKAFGSPVGDVVRRRPYLSQQSLVDATQPKGRRYYWKSEYLAKLETEMLASVIGHAARTPSPHSAIIVFPIDGALNRLAEEHSAVGRRDARYVLNIQSAWERPEEDAANVEWARGAWRDLRRFSTGGTYVNFLTEEERDDRIRDAYGRNYARLVEVKSRWDRANLFRANKNIAPT